jgi:hypothetical protein
VTPMTAIALDDIPAPAVPVGVVAAVPPASVVLVVWSALVTLLPCVDWLLSAMAPPMASGLVVIATFSPFSVVSDRVHG